MIPPSTPFRREALQRLESPERLDELMTVVGRRYWLLQAVLALLIAAGVGWSIVGRLPVRLEAPGVLVYPRSLIDLESKFSGRLVRLDVKVGDRIEPDQILGLLDRPELEFELSQRRLALKELIATQEEQAAARKHVLELGLAANEAQSQGLRKAAESERQLADRGLAERESFFAKKRAALQEQLKRSKESMRQLQQIYDQERRLLKEGLVSEAKILERRRELLAASNLPLDLQQKLSEVESQKVEASIKHEERLQKAFDREYQFAELKAKAIRLEQEELRTQHAEREKRRNLEREVASLERKLKEESSLRSPFGGRIVELTVQIGQLVNGPIGLIEAEDPEGELVCVSFYPVSMGKRIAVEMDAQISPDGVERERYGAIVARVSEVSRLPVSADEVRRTVGLSELAESFTSKGSVIKVVSRLERRESTPSGYRWSSSRGPDRTITVGTTIQSRVKVEERAPITYLIPLLREYTGTN